MWYRFFISFWNWLIWGRRIGRVYPQKRHIFQLVALFIQEYITETSLKIMQFYFELKLSSQRLNLQQFLWARVPCSTPRTFNDNCGPKTARNLVWRYCNSVVENWVLEANIVQRQIAGLSSANIMGYFSVLAVSRDLDQSHRRGRFDGILASHTGVISDGLTISLLRGVEFILSATVIG